MSMTSMKIVIGDKEYDIKGDNKELMLKSAEVVNQTYKEISDNSDIDLLTKSTLTALNIAENGLKAESEFNTKENKIVEELNKITDFIEDNLNKLK
ncbi:MAG: cell division protein ZapA [Bacteroidetes bacterium]|nr:cell division protein ZapA [Bacteroidota bacterium]